MKNVVDSFCGKLIAIISKETNKEYVNDWRNEYLDWPGLVVVVESARRIPGKIMAYLYPDYSNNMKPSSFHTSLGEYTRENQYVTIDTVNSKYIFEDFDFEIRHDNRKYTASDDLHNTDSDEQERVFEIDSKKYSYLYTSTQEGFDYMKFDDERDAKKVYSFLKEDWYDVLEEKDTYFVGWERYVLDAGIKRIVCIDGKIIVVSMIYISGWSSFCDFPDRKQYVIEHHVH